MSLCEANDSLLVIVDIQQRLIAAIPPVSLNRMIFGTVLLLDVADILAIPILCTEQYPEGLGTTITTITKHLPGNVSAIEKTCFSCAAADAFQMAVEDSRRKQIILAGMESHVCILQSAIQLAQQGKEVFVVEDAVCSRRGNHHSIAIERMRQTGVIITTTESVIFEWMRDSRHAHFKQVSALLKANIEESK